MTLDLDQATRMRFLAIDDATREALREFRPLLADHIDDMLGPIYSLIDRFPAAAKAYTSLAGYDQLRAGQKAHFLEQLFAARFDDEYFASVVRSARNRERVGLEPRWYLGSYAVIMQGINDLAIKAYRRKPERLAFILTAVNRAVMLDIDLAVSVYIQASRDSAASKLDQHAQAFEREVSAVANAVAGAAGDLHETARTMDLAAQQAEREAAAVVEAAGQASANVQTVAAATEELSASITEISRQVNDSARIAQAAVNEAGRTNQLVQGLSEAAGRIGDVVKLINSIASQTNLLALNATIEAARAGDAGKGFAVVAGEVKSLANQTAKATDEISAQIAAVQAATREAVGAIQDIGGTIANINQISSNIAAAVEEQGAATQEIARNVEEAARGTTTVTATIESVTQSVVQTGAAAHRVLGAAEQLSTQSGDLTSRVGSFLTAIRAAA